MKNIAENKFKCTLWQLALAWVISNPDVSCCILGASKGGQIDENIKALEVYKTMDKDDFIKIEKILNNTPKGEIDYLYWKELPSKRKKLWELIIFFLNNNLNNFILKNI